MGCAQLSYFLGKMFSCFPFFGSVPDCATCEKFQITEPVYSFFGSWGCCFPLPIILTVLWTNWSKSGKSSSTELVYSFGVSWERLVFHSPVFDRVPDSQAERSEITEPVHTCARCGKWGRNALASPSW